MQEKEWTVDPYLMGAVVQSCGRVPQVLYDIKKIKSLELTKQEQAVWSGRFRQREHDFSLIGEMENLHTLIISTRNPLTVDDFSFLKKCAKLKKLDLVQSNFTDCAQLSQLASLRHVRLPERHRLVNAQVLDTLGARIEFGETTTYDYPIEEIAERIREQTRKTAYALTLQKDTEPGLFDSKLGGLPYWNLKMAYPKDRTGRKMMLLAQINFDRAAVDERLPQQGMLQFFIALDECDYMYGYDGDAPDRQELFRVVYHETVDYSVTQEQIAQLDIPVSNDPAVAECTPVWKPFRLAITPQEVCMDVSDRRFDRTFRSVLKALNGKNIGRKSASDVLAAEDYWRLANALSYCGHTMLGYPVFVQFDPRTNAKYYDTVLLQLQSDDACDVCWADGGTANFFINSEALARRDFSRVLYCWDCN